MTVEIINYREINKGLVKGSVDIYLPKSGLEIFNLTYFIKEDREWISMPSKPYEKDGVQKYFPFVRFKERNHQDAFGRAVIEAIRKHQPKPQAPKQEKLFDEEVPF